MGQSETKEHMRRHLFLLQCISAYHWQHNDQLLVVYLSFNNTDVHLIIDVFEWYPDTINRYEKTRVACRRSCQPTGICVFLSNSPGWPLSKQPPFQIWYYLEVLFNFGEREREREREPRRERERTSERESFSLSRLIHHLFLSWYLSNFRGWEEVSCFEFIIIQSRSRPQTKVKVFVKPASNRVRARTIAAIRWIVIKLSIDMHFEFIMVNVTCKCQIPGCAF